MSHPRSGRCTPSLGLRSIVLGLAILVLAPRTARAGAVEKATAADGLYAVFETTLGTLVCRLDYERAPVTVGNFVGLAEGTRPFKDPETGKTVRRPFYDNLKFHRVVPGFVVQGGCPRGDGAGGPGYTFTDEFDPALRHDRAGILSMASSGPDQNGSQFFITLAPAPHLDDRQSVFGQVVLGMEVLQRMAQQKLETFANGEASKPATDIVMREVRIVRSGPAALAFDAARAFERRDEVKAKMEAERGNQRRDFVRRLNQDRKQAVRSPSGLLYLVLVPGHGEPPRPGDVISTHCTGYLEDGTKFWSSADLGKPFEVQLGSGKLIRGWEEAYLAMRPGEKRRLIIPPQLGYGHDGNQRAGIPRDATLVCDLELVTVGRHGRRP